jgi:hypothetical protein
MSDFVQEEPDNGEELIDEEGRNRTQQEMEGDEQGPAAPREGEGEAWEETNDEPAQGEGGQDIV